MPGTILTLYSRLGCHLCEDMQKDLLSMQPELAFELQVIDIDQDPQLRERYDSLVPVLVSEAGEICHYFLDKQALLEYFSSQ